MIKNIDILMMNIINYKFAKYASLGLIIQQFILLFLIFILNISENVLFETISTILTIIVILGFYRFFNNKKGEKIGIILKTIIILVLVSFIPNVVEFYLVGYGQKLAVIKFVIEFVTIVLYTIFLTYILRNYSTNKVLRKISIFGLIAYFSLFFLILNNHISLETIANANYILLNVYFITYTLVLVSYQIFAILLHIFYFYFFNSLDEEVVNEKDS